MRDLTLAVLLALIVGLVGCGDMSGSDNEAAPVSAPEQAAAAVDDSDGDTPKWAMLEQDVVYSE